MSLTTVILSESSDRIRLSFPSALAPFKISSAALQTLDSMPY